MCSGNSRVRIMVTKVTYAGDNLQESGIYSERLNELVFHYFRVSHPTTKHKVVMVFPTIIG
jgi:hypothetical protein